MTGSGGGDRLNPPYYEDDFVTIYHGDCRVILSSLGSFDVAVADPPYGDTSLAWDHWQAEWLAAMVPHTSSLWCFGSMRMFLTYALEFRVHWDLAQDIVWEKHNGSGFHADRFRRVHEHVIQWYRGDWSDIYKLPVTTPDATKRTVRRKERPPHTGEIANSTYASDDGGPRLARSVVRVRSCHGDAQHPTQKPVELVRLLIAYSCPPNGVVIDPFMGSGSTLRAAKDLGRRSVGIEISERYCEIAARRCAQEVLAL